MEKVWVYLSDKELKGALHDSILEKGKAFAESWKAHEMQLRASFDIFMDRFIVVKVDESVYNASGCSIDKLLRLIKGFENEFHLQLLNRLLVAYECDDRIEVIPASEVRKKLEECVLSKDSTVFDISVSDSVEFQNWKKPLIETWLKKYL